MTPGEVRGSIRHHLDNLKYRQTGQDPKTNGFAYAEVPDWQLRQWLEAITEAVAAERAACAEVARLYAETNIEMAQDSILADPVLDGERTPEAFKKSDALQTSGTIHSSMFHAAQNIAAAIEARSQNEEGGGAGCAD